MKIQIDELEQKLKTLVKTKQDIIKKFDNKEITEEEYQIFTKQVCDEIKEINNKKIKDVQDTMDMTIKKVIPKSKVKKKIVSKVEKKVKNKTKPKNTRRQPSECVEFGSFPITKSKVNFERVRNNRYYIKKNTTIRKIIDLLKDPKIDNEKKLLNMLKYYYPETNEDILMITLRNTIHNIKNKRFKKFKHLEFDREKYLIKETYQVRLF